MATRIGLNAGPFQLLPVTATFALPFTLYGVLLSSRVVATRIQSKHVMGDHFPTSTDNKSLSNDALYTRVRAHANYFENIPTALVLAAIAEINGASRTVLTYGLGALGVLRLLHVEAGLLGADAMGFGRPVGHFGTQIWLAATSVYVGWLVKGYWGF